MSEILDLQRDLHANDFAFCEQYTFGIRTLLLPFLFFSERVALRSMLGGLPQPSFHTATFCFCVLAVGMRTCVTHGIAGAAGISSFFPVF